MRYRTPAALEMAVKAAAKASPLDTNLAISGFYFHRLLCRVFSEKDRKFVLKGGLSVLARTVDARATRDIDLLAQETELGVAARKIELPKAFAIPASWFENYEASYKKMAKQAKADDVAPNLENAQELARKLYEPAFEGHRNHAKWNPGSMRWVEE